jgi:hypothetical protein
MTLVNFFKGMDPSRLKLLNKIHQIILASDKNVNPEVGKTMGKTMILFKEEGIFKYALSSTKDYMSLHIMTIYGSSPLHAKYKALLPKARFQKGCINFKSAEDMPAEVVTAMIQDSAKINMKTLCVNSRMFSAKD